MAEAGAKKEGEEAPVRFVLGFDFEFPPRGKDIHFCNIRGVVADGEGPILDVGDAIPLGKACTLHWVVQMVSPKPDAALYYAWITRNEGRAPGDGVLCLCVRTVAGLAFDRASMIAMHEAQFGAGAAAFPIVLQSRRFGRRAESMYRGYGFACNKVLHPVIPLVARCVQLASPPVSADVETKNVGWTRRTKIWLAYKLGMWAALADPKRAAAIVDPAELGHCAFYAVEPGAEPSLLDWRSIVIYGPKLYAGEPPGSKPWDTAIRVVLSDTVAVRATIYGDPTKPPAPGTGGWQAEARERLRNIAGELLKIWQ